MFKFSKLTESRLVGVHPKLVAVARRALELSTVDFGVADQGGVRTLAQQKEMVDRGVSKTMKSKHLKQTDGFGHALDVLPYDGNGKPQLAFDGLYTSIAVSMASAARELGVSIKWGGSWSIINDIMFFDDMHGASTKYIKAQELAGKKPFVDRPHFQIEGV